MEEWKYRPAADHGLKPADRLRSTRREAGLGAAMMQGMWRAAMRAYLSVYHRLRIEGAQHIPAHPPFVMIANHSSHLDALTLGAALPWRLRRSAFPIAAGDVFFETQGAAIFSALLLNALPMWRRQCGSHAMQELRDRLISEPAIYILFPEGTRSRDGKMGHFKAGLGMMIAGSEIPIVPCHLEGAFAAFPPNKKIPRPTQIRLRIGAPLVFADVQDNSPGWKHIASKLESAVIALDESRRGDAT